MAKRPAISPVAKPVVVRPKARRAAAKQPVGELTREEFDVVAKLLQSKEPAKTAARLVLVDGKTISEAAIEAGVLQPSASRAVRRCRETHEFILTGYAKRNVGLTP